MLKMTSMRDISNTYKLSARSIAEVFGEMEEVVARYGASRRVTFRGRKLSNEAFVNAAIIHLLALPPDRQEEALARAVARLERALLSDEPDAGSRAAITEPAPDPFPPRVVEGHPVDPASGLRLSPGPKRPRRKGAGGA